MHPTHVPLRVATGAYILNSGINKLKAGEEEAQEMHGWASSVYPFLKELKAGEFSKLLAYGEIGLGAALLFPKVPSAVAGTGLAAFGAGLMGLYLNTPGMTEEDGVRPTQQGNGLAKDVWLVGAGLTLALQSVARGTRNAAHSVADGVSGAAHSVADGVTGAFSSGSQASQGAFASLGGRAHEARESLADSLADLADSVLKR